MNCAGRSVLIAVVFYKHLLGYSQYDAGAELSFTTQKYPYYTQKVLHARRILDQIVRYLCSLLYGSHV